MTPNDLITILKLRLANSNDSNLDSGIISIANLVQERLEQGPELPWFLFNDTNVLGTNLSTVASTETVALPSDFLREEEELEYVLFVYDADESDPWVPLPRESYNKAKAKYTESGQPKYYEILGSNLYLRPIPDAVYTLRLLYFGADDDIIAGQPANNWLTYASDWIMAETGLILTSDVVPMPSLAEHYREEAQRAQRRITYETIARREAGYMRAMGGEE